MERSFTWMAPVDARFCCFVSVSSVTPVVAGDTTTWTWTLPDHFPPGKYVRVMVDGGTLSQSGSLLPWNDHGYYEVALDAGSLTLGP